ncbi:MAG: DHH family phosphoesterase [Halobacteria archaeon]
MQRLLNAARDCASEIKKHRSALIVSHIDADGLASAAIIIRALERIGIDFSHKIVKKLDDKTLEGIADQNPELVIFTDLGSGVQTKIAMHKLPAIVIDHHQPTGEGIVHHLNPHIYGYSGSIELSGAGASYLVARNICSCNDLIPLAIVGAVGDLQDNRENKLIGINRYILEEGSKLGIVAFERDLKLFGRQTRPLHKLLEYSSDPFIPSLSGNEEACLAFLLRLGINLKNEEWRRWIDLSKQEKQLIVSKLLQHCLENGISPRNIQRLIGEVYTFLKEPVGTEVRDASEFATLLNATARYDFTEVGLAVCLGDRGLAFAYARNLLHQHRKNLVEGLKFVREKGIVTLENLQYFHAGSSIRETIVGIIAGMSIIGGVSTNSTRSLPIIAFAQAEDGVKVSARGSQELVQRGLNLATALSEAASIVGGVGGGHDIAAGATIPFNSEEEFLRILDEKIGEQLGTGKGVKKGC